MFSRAIVIESLVSFQALSILEHDVLFPEKQKVRCSFFGDIGNDVAEFL